MRLPKNKKLLIVPILVLSIIGTGTAFALQPDSKSKQEDSIRLSTAKSEPLQESAPEEVSTPIETATQPSVVIQPTPTPETQPKYGEDTERPGFYRVFDRTWVMDQVGIADSDRVYVDKLLKNWGYKSTSSNVNLCMAEPAVKMQSAGTDYLDNPVTQLKWCNTYIMARHQSWSAAAAFYDKHKYF